MCQCPDRIDQDYMMKLSQVVGVKAERFTCGGTVRSLHGLQDLYQNPFENIPLKRAQTSYCTLSTDLPYLAHIDNGLGRPFPADHRIMVGQHFNPRHNDRIRSKTQMFKK